MTPQQSSMRTALLMACVLAALPAAAQKAHTHGTGKLDLAVEGGMLTLSAEIPLEDLVGFERAPRNDRERAAIDAMTAYFKSGKAFVPSADAGCVPDDAKVEATTPEKGHAELQATFVYRCAAPAQLRQVEAMLFEQYKRLKRLDARVVSGKGQKPARLTPQKRTLPLGS
jgi:hypothetical protein